MKQALTRASQELFRRTPDESFATLDDLWQNCQTQQQRSRDLWEMPNDLEAFADGGRLALRMGEDRTYRLNSWSFGQLCGLVEIGGLVERGYLAFIGEQDVHLLLDELAEFVTVTIDAEAVGQGQCDLAAGLRGNARA